MHIITRGILMGIMALLAACGGNQSPVTKVYTSAHNGQTITIPNTVSNLTLLSGQGGTGSPATSDYVEYYSKNIKVYNQRNDQGGTITTTDGGTTYHYGPTPSNYCDPMTPYYQNGVQNATQTCYYFNDQSYYDNSPATTGGTTSMTGPNSFSKTWAGGVGGPATPSTQQNVTVVPGGQYVLSIPAGGSISMSYYE